MSKEEKTVSIQWYIGYSPSLQPCSDQGLPDTEVVSTYLGIYYSSMKSFSLFLHLHKLLASTTSFGKESFSITLCCVKNHLSFIKCHHDLFFVCCSFCFLLLVILNIFIIHSLKPCWNYMKQKNTCPFCPSHLCTSPKRFIYRLQNCEQ